MSYEFYRHYNRREAAHLLWCLFEMRKVQDLAEKAGIDRSVCSKEGENKEKRYRVYM